MAKWDGHTERRIDERRRNWPDGVCAEHCLIQEFTENHRKTVCTKIAGVKLDVDELRKSTVPWKVFVLITSAAILIIGSGFGFFGVKLDSLAEKHESAMKEISTSLSSMATTQGIISYRLGNIEEKQREIGK